MLVPAKCRLIQQGKLRLIPDDADPDIARQDAIEMNCNHRLHLIFLRRVDQILMLS